MNQRTQIISYIHNKFHTEPEYLWACTPNFAVFRHADNRKWFAIIMDIPRKTLGMDGEGNTDIINVKCNIDLIGCLLKSPGYKPAYHMSKTNWVTIILDGMVNIDEIYNLINFSFQLTDNRPYK